MLRRTLVLSAVLAVAACDTAPTAAQLNPDATDSLKPTAVSVLESSSYFAAMTSDPDPVVKCALDVLGAGPAKARTAADVTVIYVWALCGEARSDRHSAFEMSCPVVIRLDGTPRAEFPRDGEHYGDDIQRMFPKSLQDAAFNPPDNLDDLEAQVRSETSPPW